MLLRQITTAGEDTRNQRLVANFREASHAQSVLIRQELKHGDVGRPLFHRDWPEKEKDTHPICEVIGSIALNAAFHAARDGGVVEMWHIAQATREELAKTENTLLPHLVADWVEASTEVTQPKELM